MQGVKQTARRERSYAGREQIISVAPGAESLRVFGPRLICRFRLRLFL
jgi:hypothetical protein